tara:strand:- start:19755 stop:20633 length:879 start_codon:yes stop_codon:yes gene_type:complete
MANKLKLDDILAKIDVPDSSPAAETSSPEPAQAQAEVESQPEPASEAKPAEVSSPEATGSSPGPIPYDRFKEKNEEAKHLKAMNEQLQKRLELMEAHSQTAQPEKAAEPEEAKADPFMERVQKLAGETDNEEVGQLLVELAQEVRQTKTQSTQNKEQFQQAQIQRMVNEYEKKLSAAIEVPDVHDKHSARAYVLQVLHNDPSADIGEAVKVFKEHERKLEDAVLTRHGYKRSDGQPEALPSADSSDGLPSRAASSGASSPVVSETEQNVQSKKPFTLRDLQKSFNKGRRRSR